MIPARELFDLRAEWSLDVGVIEKDYVLGWLLAGITNHPNLAGTWVFKGGTCLRKCFYETYRFSEDLDFTVVEGGPETPEELQPIFATIGEWVREESGIELVVDEATFRRRRNRRGNATTEGRIAYRGPNSWGSTDGRDVSAALPHRVLSRRPATWATLGRNHTWRASA